MRVFVGFGYNKRDKWIEEQVFPVLQGMGFLVVDGKDMHGQILEPEVQSRIDQSDAVIGFFTIRAGQGEADFNSHIWVRDELIYASAKGKPIIPIRENGARIPDGLLGNRQYIALNQKDRLGCVAEIARALGRRDIRRLRLEPQSNELSRDLHQWRRNPLFTIHYRIKDVEEAVSPFRSGQLEQVDFGFYINVADVPRRAFVEVEGRLNGEPKFSSGWATADAVPVKII